MLQHHKGLKTDIKFFLKIAQHESKLSTLYSQMINMYL